MENTGNGSSEKGQKGGNGYSENDSGRLDRLRGESEKFRFSGAGGVAPSCRPWSGFEPGSADDSTGGIGSRLIVKLLEQRAEVLSRLDVVNQRKAEYESKLQQIDRELTEAREMLVECLDLTDMPED